MPTREENSVANSEKKPLDELQLFWTGDDAVRCMIPALDKRWTRRTIFATYTSLIQNNGKIKSHVDLEQWQLEAECFQADMQYLLQRSHHIFWSYMVHQKSAIAAVTSFLQHATPFYLELEVTTTTQKYIKLYENILCQVLRIICRIITNKETPDSFIRKEHLAELIYKNYLITIPMLFDLVVAIGDASTQNSTILRRIFQTVLDLEPKYKNDMLTSLAFFRAAFRSIQTQADNEGFEGAGGGTLDDNVETPYDDVVLYTLDCSFSLSVLLEVCPQSRTFCADINLGKCIATFYDSTIPNLYKNICQISDAATSLSWLNQSRLQFLSAFRNIANSYVEAVLTKPEDSLIPVESFLALMTDCLSEQTFVVDYERQYPIALDIDILKQACPNLDDFKANFILRGYQQEAEQQAARTYDNIETLTQSVNQISLQQETSNATNPQLVNGIKDSVDNNKTTAVPERDIDLEVTAVLDIYPHLGTGFVRRVLSRYENSDQAVAAILEENLPPDLVNADQNEPYIPEDPQDKLYLETGVKHFNVYDGDAYDVMTRDKPECIIKRGKGLPNAPRNAAQLLDDKSGLKEIRHRYQAYTLVTEDPDEDNANAEYDDEYDDSYEALLESETRVVRSKDLKAVLANVDDISEDDDDDDQEDENGGNDNGQQTQQNRRMNFCENPEDVRARYEARRQAKWSQRGGNVSGNSNKQQDVVGGPKGQGQDKDTLRNRQKKEAHKSSRANHNRKAGAAFKRSKGMLS